jgi:microcystin-dependent protein
MNWFMGLTYTSIKWCQDSILTLAGSQLVPAGAVVQFAAASPPTGWLLCDGSAVSQVTYANLYSVLGTTWGPDAGGNFTLPDLRKAVLAGYDSSDTGTVNFATLGAVVGAKTHALSTGEMPGHTHPLTRYTGGSFPGPTHEGVQYDNVNQTLSATVSSQSTGSGDPHNIIQLSATVNHIIKY